MGSYEIFSVDLNNLEIKEIDFGSPDEKVDDGDKMTIKLSNGDILVFQSIHNQDCYERVYADWSYFDKDSFLKKNKGKTFGSLTFRGVESEGLLLIFQYSNSLRFQKEFIPCYNEQNGYYSNDLILFVYKNCEEIGEYDLSKLSEFVDR